jgi:hypothetical protein
MAERDPRADGETLEPVENAAPYSNIGRAAGVEFGQ